MMKRAVWSALMVCTAILFYGCGEKLELRVNARMDGKPAAQAKITVDGKEEGITDANGVFSKTMKKKPGAEVEVVVSKEMPGYRIKPWKNIFLMKLPKDGAVDKYSFDADLAASRYVTLAVTEQNAPVQDAAVAVSGKQVGKTDAKGEFLYEYAETPAGGAEIMVSKSGYAPWRKKDKLEPGAKIDVALSKRVLLTVTSLVEEYGKASGVPDVAVSIDKKQVGKTDARGLFSYAYDGAPGKKVQVTLSSPGMIPASWSTTVVLEGEISLQRYFYPTTPKPIRAGIYRFVGNTPGLDLKTVLEQTEQAVASQIFKYKCFREVPSKNLRDAMKQAKLGIDKITAKGWRETPLNKTVDMIILGSVAKDEKGFVIETKFHTSGGKLLMSQLNRARSADDIKGAAKEIAAAIMERFPFEGTVISRSEDDRYRINLGKPDYKINRGTEFALMTARRDESGKIASYRDIGKLRVKKAEDSGSWTEVEDLKKGEKINVGDRVVRRVYREEDDAARNYFTLQAKGGMASDVAPLSGVNIYLNEEWVGTTGSNGNADIPVRIGKRYDLVLYRHGYQQIKQPIKIEQNKEAKAFVLQVNNSLFKIESLPSSAEVYLDGDKIGSTPISAGKLVPLGFHTVKVSAGGDYRDWEEVLEFAQKEEDRTGARKIVLQKDYLKMGERLEQKGDIDGAIQAYVNTQKEHPDYSPARARLAQLYLDQKSDYDGAIREFENVLSLPENKELLYKQYAVAYTNLGHAYYEKGSGIVQSNGPEASQAFSKAIDSLKIAKLNTRFFPNVQYDEALHDTYYYLALSYHKLYLLTRKPVLLTSANLAWREYFDFFPKKLEGNSTFDQSRETAQKYWDQIKNL